MYDHPEDTNFGDVGRFHSKFGLHNATRYAGPQEFDQKLMGFRLNFLLEELTELMQSMGAEIVETTDGQYSIDFTFEKKVDHAQAFDALIDLVYVALGTAHLMGYPWQEGWNRVQAANMSKVRAQADGSDSKRGSSFDVVKPPGWTPPDIEGLLQIYGWDMNQ